MIAQDEKLRRRLSAALTIADIDVRNLTIEVANRHVSVKGAVPTLRQKARLTAVLREQLDNSLSLDCDVAARELEPARGRPALTATSVD